MKFVTIALVIALAMPAVFSITPVCTASNYCQGCSAVTLGNCTSCFSWGTGTVLARLLVSNACTTKRSTSLDTNCQIYGGSTTTDVKAVETCNTCKSGYVHVRAYTSTLSSSSLSTNWTSTTCTKSSSTYAEVSNCRDGNTVFVTGTGLTASSFCMQCNKNYKNGTTLDANKGGFTTCVSGAAYTNCEYSSLYNWSGYDSTTTNTGSNAVCYSCASKYAVASTGITCTSFTTDSNCRQLTSTSVCGACWYSYYFDASKCKLASSLLSIAGFALAALLALF